MAEKKTVIGEYQEKRREAREFVKQQALNGLEAAASQNPESAKKLHATEQASAPAQKTVTEALETTTHHFNYAVYKASYALHRHAPALQAIDAWSCEHIGSFVPSSCKAVEDAGAAIRADKSRKK